MVKYDDSAQKCNRYNHTESKKTLGDIIMPSKLDKIKLPIGKDRRQKISKEIHAEIKDLYLGGTLSYSKIAEMYCVSKSRIIQICNPDIEDRQKNQFAERRKDGRYYDKEKHRQAVANLRIYKKQVLSEK